MPEPEQITVLKKRKVEVNMELDKARKPWNAHSSFDSRFWAQASRVESISIERAEIDREISLFAHNGDEDAWQHTEEAKTILERIHAHRTAFKIYESRANPNPPRASYFASLRRSWLELFTTSRMGMKINTGAGKRDPSLQSAFRGQLIEKYNARHANENWLWCPVLQDWVDAILVKAAHIFPCMHGSEAMEAIFGKKSSQDLFAPSNGLLMCGLIESEFDAGKLVVVPDVADDSSLPGMICWIVSEPREYKIKLLDRSDEFRNRRIMRASELTFGELHNRKLKFRSSFRPAARYLYFHFCVQVLRSGWRRNNEGKASEAAKILESETGKPLWATPGRYLPKSMLRALVEEPGHEYEPLMAGAKSNFSLSSSSNSTLMELAAAQVKDRRRRIPEDLFDEVAADESFSIEEDIEWSGPDD